MFKKAAVPPGPGTLYEPFSGRGRSEVPGVLNKRALRLRTAPRSEAAVSCENKARGGASRHTGLVG